MLHASRAPAIQTRRFVSNDPSFNVGKWIRVGLPDELQGRVDAAVSVEECRSLVPLWEKFLAVCDAVAAADYEPLSEEFGEWLYLFDVLRIRGVRFDSDFIDRVNVLRATLIGSEADSDCDNFDTHLDDGDTQCSVRVLDIYDARIRRLAFWRKREAAR